MTVSFGIQGATGTLRRVLVRRPDRAFAVDEPAVWNYVSRPDLATAQLEHDQLVEVLAATGAVVETHPAEQPGRADAIFVFDPVLMTGGGAVLLRMGKSLRQGEESALGQRLAELGIPVLGSLTGDALAEGGDLLRLDAGTLAVGIGFRTNESGLAQLETLLRPQGIRLVAVELPYFEGPRACLHLLSLVSLVDSDLAVVYPRLMPVTFWRQLAERYELIEVPDEEFATMAPNVLALAPRKCLMLEGNPRTRRRLERAGCEVHTYTGNELSLKAEGGPTCLTLPLWRDPR